MSNRELPTVDVIEIDVGNLKTLDEQQDCCIQMLDDMLIHEKNIKNRITCIQTINGMLQSDDILTSELGEYVGYHYGQLNTYLSTVSTALLNINSVVSGELDDIELDARNMYISLWYNIGNAGLNAVDDCINELEKMEMDLIELAPRDEAGFIVIKGVTMH